MPLGEEYSIEFEEKRMQILRESARLFSFHSFDGVSMKQIAQAVDIKAPSLYNHFKCKEEILSSIYSTCTEWMEEYYKRFKEQDIQAASIEESMENIFVEVRRVVDMFPFYAITIAQRHAPHDPAAYDLFYNAFYYAGIKSITACYQRGIEKGYVPKSVDISSIATLIMDFVAHNNTIQVVEYFNASQQPRTREFFDRVQKYFVALSLSGI